MRVTQYNASSSGQIAAAVVTTARSPHSPRGASSNPQDYASTPGIIDVGGGWLRNTWRDGLRRLAGRGAVTVIGLRAQPTDRSLSDADWRRITRGFVARAGVEGQPWAAARTSPTTVAVLTETSGRPLNLDRARAYAASAASRQPNIAASTPNAAGGAAVNRAAPTSGTSTAGSVVRLNFTAPPDTGAVASAPGAGSVPTPSAVPRHTR
jgi:hypothetical protein